MIIWIREEIPDAVHYFIPFWLELFGEKESVIPLFSIRSLIELPEFFREFPLLQFLLSFLSSAPLSLFMWISGGENPQLCFSLLLLSSYMISRSISPPQLIPSPSSLPLRVMLYSKFNLIKDISSTCLFSSSSPMDGEKREIQLKRTKDGRDRKSYSQQIRSAGEHEISSSHPHHDDDGDVRRSKSGRITCISSPDDLLILQHEPRVLPVIASSHHTEFLLFGFHPHHDESEHAWWYSFSHPLSPSPSCTSFDVACLMPRVVNNPSSTPIDPLF